MTSSRQAILKKTDPQAFEDPIINRAIEHEHRMATDPEVLARRKAIDREVMLATSPALIIAVAIMGAAGYLAYRVFPVLPLPMMVGGPMVMGVVLWLKVFGPSSR